MRTYNVEGQVSLFAPDGSAGKMCLAPSAQGTQKVRTSSSSCGKLSELQAIPFLSLDLTPGHGNLLGESYWELISPSPGGSSTLNTGPAPLNAEDVYSLSQILQDDPHPKYYLSRTACLGILRRAKERGKELPPQLELALRVQAGLIPAEALQQSESQGEKNGAADCLTPWDTQQARIFTPEGKAPTLASADGGGGRNPGGLLFSAGFCAGAGSAAGSIGYQEELSPTLKASASGNMMPSILCLTDHGGQRMDITADMTPTLRAQMGVHLPLICLNDQGGGIMSCSEEVAGTLRAQEHGHQPLIFENHGIDARYTGPHPVSPTIPARAGTGGNNLPLVSEMPETLCILGNTVDCAPENGGHGLGIQEDLAYTLTAEHRHAVFSRQRSDHFREKDVASTESAQQDKDTRDLVYQAAQQAAAEAIANQCASKLPQLIRRLTPLECELLQGFPSGWTDIPGASDSARYKALGNSVAIPCVEFIMRGIAMAVEPPAYNTSIPSHDRSPHPLLAETNRR